jgi:hypothetical protein
MKVSMDGLRKKLIVNYNSLVKKLNSSIDEDEFIQIDPSYISRELDMIRIAIVTLAFTSQEGNDDWQEMDEDTHFEEFNP